MVGNKADMTAVRQDYILQPEAFCAKHRVIINLNCFALKIFVKTLKSDLNEIFQKSKF